MGQSLLWELVNSPAVFLARAVMCLVWSAVIAVALWALTEYRAMRR